MRRILHLRRHGGDLLSGGYGMGARLFACELLSVPGQGAGVQVLRKDAQT